MKNNFDKIEELFGILEALRPLTPEQQEKVDKKFRLEFNYNSNHLEGNTLTYGETELLLIFDDTKGNHTLREYEEMKAHDVAYQLIEEWAKDKEVPLSEHHIKNLNKIILVRPYWKDALTSDGQNTRRQIKVGNYKEYPNSVRLANGEMFHYTSPTNTPIEMQELIEWYRSEESVLHPITLAAMLHYKFVRIHPFDDGNGRISRLLVNYVLLKNNYPPIVIKSDDKNNYLKALHLADIGEYDSFIDYIAEQAAWSLSICIKAGRGESIDEKDDLDKEIILLKRQLQGENILNIPVSKKAISEALTKNIIPLCDTAENKLLEVREFFFRDTRNISFTFNKGNGLTYREHNWDNISEQWNYNRKDDEKVMLLQINYNYELSGFKKSLQANSFWVGFEINFNEFNYIIRAKNSQNIELIVPYGKKIVEEEILKLIKPVIIDVINAIKNYL
ncbi:Fic family protein [Ferruginibacter sp. HRS2-29]|uniref:Fic family protein n=1 Tax=Ferruginibacter sp. HRS2-29 TaxID=2487334 RepID=UPI0020CBFB90|nr:Fic family protein [Ferruginibacter sp. HRS2-29]MCP9752876.1 Fic family protein [Ferruginibacter sp. HRS2-29]